MVYRKNVKKNKIIQRNNIFSLHYYPIISFTPIFYKCMKFAKFIAIYESTIINSTLLRYSIKNLIEFNHLNINIYNILKPLLKILKMNLVNVKMRI